MALSPEQALDEATHRKVEGAFDELQRAARNIEAAAREIEASGGEQRLADLLASVSGDLREKLKETMSKAYFRPPTEQESIALGEWKGTLPGPDHPGEPEDQVRLFADGEPEDDSLAA